MVIKPVCTVAIHVCMHVRIVCYVCCLTIIAYNGKYMYVAMYIHTSYS